MMDRVLVESPFAGRGDSDRERYIDQAKNIEYARACLRDCLERGEAPFASHLLYTQKGVLDDDDPEERRLGIEAGLVWGAQAVRSIVYVDRGITPGMRQGIEQAEMEDREVVYRSLEKGEIPVSAARQIMAEPKMGKRSMDEQPEDRDHRDRQKTRSLEEHRAEVDDLKNEIEYLRDLLSACETEKHRLAGMVNGFGALLERLYRGDRNE